MTLVTSRLVCSLSLLVSACHIASGAERNDYLISPTLNPPGGGADYRLTGANVSPSQNPTGGGADYRLTGANVSPSLNPPGGGADYAGPTLPTGLKKRKKAKSSTLPTGLKPAPVNARVVSSVVTQLEGGLYSKCHRIVVSVSNYTVQEELGRTIIRFTLELQHRNDGNCHKKNKEKERCSVKAQTTTGHLEVLWDSTSCYKEGNDTDPPVIPDGELEGPYIYTDPINTHTGPTASLLVKKDTDTEPPKIWTPRPDQTENDYRRSQKTKETGTQKWKLVVRIADCDHFTFKVEKKNKRMVATLDNPMNIRATQPPCFKQRQRIKTHLRSFLANLYSMKNDKFGNLRVTYETENHTEKKHELFYSVKGLLPSRQPIVS